MKKNIKRMIALVLLSLFVGASSIAYAEKSTLETSSDGQMVVTLPEIVCKAEKISIIPKVDYREYLNEAMESIRENLERIQLKNIMEEVKSILSDNNM